MNPYGYSDEVWRLFGDTPNAGTLEGTGVVRVRVEDPARNSLLELQWRVEGERVAEARFRALGCPTTIAVGAWLATASAGRPLSALVHIDAAAIRRGLQLPDDRAHCALLGEDLIRAGLKAVE